MDRFRNLLNHVVQEMGCVDKLNRFNHCPHFPFFMAHFTDSMPVSSMGGNFLADLWNPKYASHIYKVTVAVDMLGNIVWICPLAHGISANVLIWDGYGPSRRRGEFFDFEVGGHDGAPLYIVASSFIVRNTHHWTKGGKCLWLGDSVNEKRPLLSPQWTKTQ